ncbi:putative mediator of RNA polymerase II transcription subunit 26 [Salvia splendens]|nr:putative mediator of RNA polymerase II transcription subunit 26 [Salvia splendens]XP_042066718.1 putative mediator of RNA polymerase II transcription subunit 26 [Salvia splendens]
MRHSSITMEENKAQQHQQQQQQQQQLLQQQLLMQQIQRQKDAMSRFPSNIDAHLRPQGQAPAQHPSLLQSRPLTSPNPNPNSAPQQPNQLHPNSNPNPNPNPNSSSASTTVINQQQQQQQQQHKASLQLAYQDAWRVCHPDFKRPFSSLEDACERLLPYHVVADYEAEEDDKILDTATTGQILSRSQQWDNNIAAKVAEFTATFEKQVLAFNIISRKRGLGEFRTEEKLMMEQFLLQEEKRSLLELRAEMDSRQKASRESHEANMRMAAMAHVDQARAESQAHAEMMARAPIRGSALGSRGNSSISDMGEQEQDFHQDEIMNGWGSNAQKDDREPSEDFLNDDETENGDNALQSEWPEGGELDLNAR